MDIKNIAVDDLLASSDDGSVSVESRQTAGRGNGIANDIAIVGMAGSVGSAQNLDEFWKLLAQGRSAVRDIPEARKADVQEYLRISGAAGHYQESDFIKEAFLNRIDAFDHNFFGLSKQEANWMDPQQRLFLETAWTALEDAGYASDAIRGTKTGIFAGISQDFGENYSRLIGALAPDAPEISIVGNIKSVIASRLAYILDFKGPSMVVDTACSSALVALHLACRSIVDGECDSAIVGTVNLNLVPVLAKKETGIGVKDIEDNLAADSQTKAFDERSDGMSVGEGAFAFYLKPLAEAEAAGDRILAVIRGSAINQDGYSMGLTAPNSAAQADLIQSAWQNAGVNGRDVSYIEAHGTGTKLGDPIEISGLRQAFSSVTQRSQFCAIGSVKSNIGHLDNAAGLAGLAKVVLAMQHRQIPASLHFQRPNKKIAFEHSPVFVNDRLSDWDSAKPSVLAGVSSYGLSGTNCHVVLQSVEASKDRVESNSANPDVFWLLPLSGRSDKAVKQLAKRYLKFLKQDELPSLQNLCFTASVGRPHHSHRLALVCSSYADLKRQLRAFADGKKGAYFYGSFRLVADDTASEGLSEQQQNAYSEDASQFLSAAENKSVDLKQVASLYCKGAEVPWAEYLSGKRVGLPTYPFERARCWVSATHAGELLASNRGSEGFIQHPLLDQALETQDLVLYRSTLDTQQHWVLADHKIGGLYVLPGTCYVEMMLAIGEDVAGIARASDDSAVAQSILNFESIQFLNPFIAGEGERKELHLQVRRSAAANGAESSGENFEVKACSKDGEGFWQDHAAAQFTALKNQISPAATNIDDFKVRLDQTVEFAVQDDVDRGLEISDRWYGSYIGGVCNADHSEFLFEFSLPEKYRQELNFFRYHPALLDTAVNAANHMMGSGELYLPFLYKNFRVFKPLAGDCFFHFKRSSEKTNEVVTFEVSILDTQGEVCATIGQYGIKKAPQFGANGPSQPEAFVMRLIDTDAPILVDSALAESEGEVLVIHRGSEQALNLIENLGQSGVKVLGLNRNDGDYEAALKTLFAEKDSFDGVIYAAAWQDELPEHENRPFVELTQAVNSLLMAKVSVRGAFTVLTRGAFAENPNPIQAAIATFARAASLENPTISIRCLDVAAKETDIIMRECLTQGSERDAVRIVNDGRYLKESLDLLSLPPESKNWPLSDEGVYIITGGTGGLGLELAHEWAKQAGSEQKPLNLALTSTTKLPERAQWAELLKSPTTPLKLRKKIERLKSISALGATISCHAVDSCDREETEALLEDLRAQHGSIKGIVHAAGRAGDGFLINKAPGEMHKVMAPKVQGAWLLHELTLKDPLEFFVLYSSIASHFIEAGQSDYSAANRFLDGLSAYRRSLNLPAISVCWPAWRETGIAVEYNAVREDELFFPINTQEALAMLRRVMSHPEGLPPAVVLSRLNEDKSVEEVEQLGLAFSDGLTKRLRKRARAGASDNGVASQIALSGLDAIDEFDQAVGEIWAKVLELSELHADEVFNDLGGNSILIIQKHKAFEQRYPGVMDMTDLFTHTTLREQAALLRKALAPKEQAIAATENQLEQELEQQLARLAAGEISVEELQALV